MGKSNIDPIIQNKLQNFKSELDTEALWNTISGSIPATPMSPVTSPSTSVASSATQVIKATTLLLALSITAGVIYSLYTPSQHTTDQVVYSDQTTTNSNNTNANDASTPISNHDQSDNAKTPNAKRSTEPAITTQNLETQASVTLPTDNPLPTHLSPTQSNASNAFTSSEEPLSPHRYTDNSLISSPDNTLTQQATSVNAQQGLQTILHPLSQSTTGSKQAHQLLSQAPRLNQRMGYLDDTRQEMIGISLSDLAPIKDKINCYDYSSNKPQISLVAYYGPGMSSRSLQANTTDMTNYKSAREDTEVMLENHRAGLQLKVNHKSGLYGKVGLESSVINEKFSQYTETRREEVQYGLIETITYPDGEIEEIYGDRIVTIISKKEWKNYNKFETIDLSAYLGYEVSINKWKYHAEAGILYNLGTRFEGTFLDATTLLPEEADPNYYKSKTGIDLHFAGGIGYDLTRHSTVWLSPSVRYDLNSVNQSSFPLDQKYLMGSLLASLEYRF